jgi:Cu-Zn family superoxide dismutase
MKPNRLIVASAAVLLAGLAVQTARSSTVPPPSSAEAASARSDRIAKAKATLHSCTDPNVAVGSVLLVEVPSAEAVKVVQVFISVHGLTPGKHAVHVHAVGACTPTCAAAGSHLDLGPFGNNAPVTDNHPWHSGDLVNINVGANGQGILLTTTNRIALTEPPDRPDDRPLSLFDADGSSIVVHAMPDLYCPDPTDPNCAGGGRAACGIIEPAD